MTVRYWRGAVNVNEIHAAREGEHQALCGARVANWIPEVTDLTGRRVCRRCQYAKAGLDAAERPKG